MGILRAPRAKALPNVAKACRSPKRTYEVKVASVIAPSQTKQRRVGIYAGTFDPVHTGHIAFALQALDRAELDVVYFVPEREPRGKVGVTHFAHRIAMVRRALQSYAQLQVLELPDKCFSVSRTLPRLRQLFLTDELVFFCGSDVLAAMVHWPYIQTLLTTSELCVGQRKNETKRASTNSLAALPCSPRRVTMLKSYAPAVSSRHVRQAIRAHRHAAGLLRSVQAYAAREWLYV